VDITRGNLDVTELAGTQCRGHVAVSRWRIRPA
jgi:hypothetical protein